MARRIIFRTNLDEARRYLSQLDAYDDALLPPVGARIDFYSFSRDASFQLEVVGLVYDAKAERWCVDLHIPSTFAGQSIREWMDWFARHVKGEVR